MSVILSMSALDDDRLNYLRRGRDCDRCTVNDLSSGLQSELFLQLTRRAAVRMHAQLFDA